METKNDLAVTIVEGEIRQMERYATEVIIEMDGVNTTFSFDEPVREDEIVEALSYRLLEQTLEEREEGFDYTEPQRFRGESNTSEALIQLFYMFPCTTSQFSDYTELDYASSYPSKLRDKGLTQAVGEVGSKTIWVLTPRGIKEAMCLIGHPETTGDLRQIMYNEEMETESSGLSELFPEESLEDSSADEKTEEDIDQEEEESTKQAAD